MGNKKTNILYLSKFLSQSMR